MGKFQNHADSRQAGPVCRITCGCACSPQPNLTIVLFHSIMSSTSGLRPFDIETFRQNDAIQPLRAVSSTVRSGRMETVAFGSEKGDFWDIWVEEEVVDDDDEPKTKTPIAVKSRIKRSAKAIRSMIGSVVNLLFKVVRKTRNVGRRLLRRKIISEKVQTMDDGSKKKKTSLQLREATACPDNSGKKGLFACLESSMLVPGAAGPPLKLLRSRRRKDALSESFLANSTNVCFDAFACK